MMLKRVSCFGIAILIAALCMQAAWAAAPRVRVYVAGEQIAFAHAELVNGDPVAPAADPGMAAMLRKVGAALSWQPGTNFVAVTRSDGKLITFSVGSSALTLDGNAVGMPFAPFVRGPDFYVPLLPLARALALSVRGFPGGYVFVPQLLSIKPALAGRRTLLSVVGSAPLAWHSSFNARRKVLGIAFAGFGTSARKTIGMYGRDAFKAAISETGPPGYPTTSIQIALRPGVKYAARRSGSAAMDVILSRDAAALREDAFRPAPARPGHRMVQAAMLGLPSQPSSEPSPSAAASPAESPSAPASPSALPEQKITDVSLSEQPDGTRITLQATGAVRYSWHRLAPPDNRYWLDVEHAVLIGPAQSLTSKLPFVKEIKVSQHQLVPEPVVRVSVTPAQPLDVSVSQGVEDQFQLVIDIAKGPPAADAPSAGSGAIGAPSPEASAPPVHRAPTKPDLVVIDAGHGGNDPGSVNRAYGLLEKRLTLALAQRVQRKLKDLGWQTALTREGDYEVGDPGGDDRQELQARCDIANAAGARLFVSIHINSSISPAPSGATTYYWRRGDKPLARSLQSALVADAGVADDGVRREAFYVIRHTNMQAALVEAAYLSNPHDAQLLNQTSFLDKLAAGIVHGINDYTGGPPSS
jgi:N-acetylmuramoyl-L-alanine amidase